MADFSQYILEVELVLSLETDLKGDETLAKTYGTVAVPTVGTVDAGETVGFVASGQTVGTVSP